MCIEKKGPEVNNQGADNRGWTKPLGIVRLYCPKTYQLSAISLINLK